MPRYIIKIKDKYFEWSTIVDAPITDGMTKEELEEHIRFKYGDEGIKGLPGRLKRIESTNTSCLNKTSLKDLTDHNRAGKNESCLTIDEIYDKYT